VSRHLITTGRIEVYTFKEGLLSPLAHDLRLRLERFEIAYDSAHVTARFWPASLVVEGVARDGRVDASGLSAAQKAEITGNIRDRILRTDSHPEAVYEAAIAEASGARRLSGTLELCGRSKPLEIVVEESAGKYTGSVELRPSLWGIQPFRAMLGTIRLQDRVSVRFEVPVGPELVGSSG
jgi:hypothetical protein